MAASNYNGPSYLSAAAYYNTANGKFDLSGYRLGPGDSASIPFTLTSMPLSGRRIPDGFLAFEISGRIEVTRY